MRLADECAARTYLSERCDADAFAKLEVFVAELREANDRQNLVSKGSMQAVWLRHIADSAQLIDHVPRGTSPWLDLGSGAGFPGVIAAIMCPQRSFVLVEARRLRAEWLQYLIGRLDLKGCSVLASDVGHVPGFPAAVISARAFAPLPRLLALSAKFSTVDTHWVLPKGRSAAQEVAALPADLSAMFHVKPSASDAEAGIVVGRGQIPL